MLRKRTGSLQKDQLNMVHITNSDASSQSHHAFGRNIKATSIFKLPCLFVGLGPNKGLLDSDSVRSPTSPLDARVLSILGNQTVRSPRLSPLEGHQRSWDGCKVGLSIVESLEYCSKFCGQEKPSSLESKKISFSPQMMIKTPNCSTCSMDSFESSKSLPKDFCKLSHIQNESAIHKGSCCSTVLFEIEDNGLELEPFERARSCSLNSCSPLKSNSRIFTITASKNDSDTEKFAMKFMPFSQVSSPPNFNVGSQNSDAFPPTESESNTNGFFNSLSAGEIELSEDYTCVICHGPNPKTTHIYGDCILESNSDVFIKNHFKNKEKEKEGVTLIGNDGPQTPNQYPSSDFLSFCHHCNKKLEEGKDIYIYGGEKAFCSLTCRSMEIMIDEELEESNPTCEKSPKLNFGEHIFETGIPTATKGVFITRASHEKG